MIYYTRKQVLELLELDDGFLTSLLSEEIVTLDAPQEAGGEFSERMLERVRELYQPEPMSSGGGWPSTRPCGLESKRTGIEAAGFPSWSRPRPGSWPQSRSGS